MRQPALLFQVLLITLATSQGVADEIDFNRDIRPILSNKCFACHGPDKARLQGGLRLDDRDIAIRPLESGSTAITPGRPDASELVSRVSHSDADVRMPPSEFGKPLSEREIATLRQWIQEGAKYAAHWSYVKPQRPEPPRAAAEFAAWPRNPIDNFVLARMQQRGLKPSPEADRYTLARRVALDLTGLPLHFDEVEAFVHSSDERAYETLVDRLLSSPSFGEHWARQWLDLARYADSAGYADDPPRTIWAYRDWVIRSLNANMPFDQFTVRQLAGDLLPDATNDELIATAFHRNTLTNNEGGTQDEEFRNVAVVDRVNTTMAVWMGTTMACAQCHSHKYDPISQEEYFRFFAIFNNTQDADRRDESPLVELLTEEQQEQREQLAQQIADLEARLVAPDESIVRSQKAWEQQLRQDVVWRDARPESVARSSGLESVIREDGVISVNTAAETDVYTVDLRLPRGADGESAAELAAIRLQTLPDSALPGGGSGLGGGNFVVTEVRAQLVPVDQVVPAARFVRVELPGTQKILSLAEVQVLSGGTNIGSTGLASQSSTDFDGPASLAIDGTTSGDFQKKSVTHTASSDNPWWELDLQKVQAVERIVIWNRTDNDLQSRLAGFRLMLLDADRQVVWERSDIEAPQASIELAAGGVTDIHLATAIADYSQEGFAPAAVLDGKSDSKDGWAVGGSLAEPHWLVLVPKASISVTRPSLLRLIIEQKSPHKDHLLGRFRVSTTADRTAAERAGLPKMVLTILETPEQNRDAAQQGNLNSWYREHAAPQLADVRKQLAAARQQRDGIKAATSVPVLRELTENRRETRLQYRGNYLDKGPVVSEGVPAAFHVPAEAGPWNRLALAQWLVHPDNPLTARVLANRYWETLFGRGIVLTSEEFGSQGELPTHPELLDWLATELHSSHWNTKAALRLMVTSATYRQSARVTPEEEAADPDNRWLSRGPRVRLSAEMVRDQALFVSGLLSDRMYGPPVKPPQPSLGLTAAFGSSTDWKTSEGDDRYRRGLYTTWRRSNPYPSMATFDAPNREVCTIRRNRTNTPLQSLVTLNDPVYVEAAQALARRTLQHDARLDNQLQFAVRSVLMRAAEPREVAALANLFQTTQARMTSQPDDAQRLATDPLGPLPEHVAAADAAAMTVVCNVLLNLDEVFLKR